MHNSIKTHPLPGPPGCKRSLCNMDKIKSYYEQLPGLAPSQLLCRLLSSKNDPVIKYACMQIRVLLCTESGTTVSLNWNEPVSAC